MKMDIHIERIAKALDKRRRPRMRFLPLDAACNRLDDIVLTDRGEAAIDRAIHDVSVAS
jgi:hypothetical protein